MEPAAIRCKNPGAMWGRVGRKPDVFFTTSQGPHGVNTNAPIPLKWGSTKTIYLSDGLGQDNNIAIFDTWVAGICAQFDLWRTSAHYHNKRFADAIAIWSGGNNVPSYIALIKARVPGMTENTIMDDAFWRGPMAIPFLKAQAGHEAGAAMPAAEADWIEAQRRVFANKVPIPAPAKKTATAAVIVNTTTTAVAASGGFPWWGVVLVIAAGIGLSVFAAWFFHREGED